MTCQRAGEEAYRYVQGALSGKQRKLFEEHLAECQDCKHVINEAQRLEKLGQDSSKPVDSGPPEIATEVTIGLMESGSRTRRRTPGRSILSVFHLRSVALLTAVSFIALVFVVISSPSGITAHLQSWLYFVPGMGINEVDENTRVLKNPVVVREGRLTFAVETLLSQGNSTSIHYRLSGLLPEDKRVWSSMRPAGSDPDSLRGSIYDLNGPKPYFRTPQGVEFIVHGSSTAVGGDETETVVSGYMGFDRLPSDLESVELVVPLAYLVPSSVATEPEQFIVKIPLVRPEDSGSTPAQPLSASTSKNGITVSALSIAHAKEGEVVQVKVVPADSNSTIVDDLCNPFGQQQGRAVLIDGDGNEHQADTNDGIISKQPYIANLRFPTANGSPQPMTLRINTVRLLEGGAGSFAIPLKGHKVGDIIPIGREVRIGDYKALVESAEIIDEYNRPALRIRLDLGPERAGKMLMEVKAGTISFSNDVISYDKDTGQENSFTIAVDLNKEAVEIVLERPETVAKGPWELKLAK